MENFASTPSPEATEVLIRRVIRDTYTHLPGIITSFDPDKQVAKVIPAIQATINIDNKIEYKDLPELIEVPVMFCYGQTAGFSLTYPVNIGDECLLSFSMKSIDVWHDTGEISKAVEPVSSRSHSISDGIAFVGLSSKPNVINKFQNNCIEIRNKSRASRMSVYDNRVEVVSSVSNIAVVPGVPSTSPITMIGIPGTVIPAGSKVSDQGNAVLWETDSEYTIGPSGTVSGSITSILEGPFSFPANSINKIQSAVPGWTVVNNPSQSVPGSFEEENETITGVSSVVVNAAGDIVATPASGLFKVIGGIEATLGIEAGEDIISQQDVKADGGNVAVLTHKHNPTGSPPVNPS